VKIGLENMQPALQPRFVYYINLKDHLLQEALMSKKGVEVITVLIADAEPVARAGIRTLLARAKDIEIVGEAQNGFEVKKMIAKFHPKILLLDLKIPDLHPYKVEKWVRKNHPGTVTLVLTSHDRDDYLAGMIDAGIAGYLSKGESAEHLISAVHRVAEGTVCFSEEQITRAQKWKETVQEKWNSLTHREKELLRLLTIGKDNKTIAKSLNVTLKTVGFHMTNIMKKLNMNSRDEVIIWMLKYHPDDSIR
jgi:DNA-binding NarL/FixJ family response regulator